MISAHSMLRRIRHLIILSKRYMLLVIDGMQGTIIFSPILFLSSYSIDMHFFSKFPFIRTWSQGWLCPCFINFSEEGGKVERTRGRRESEKRE
jgi:hypothetical protein